MRHMKFELHTKETTIIGKAFGHWYWMMEPKSEDKKNN